MRIDWLPFSAAALVAGATALAVGALMMPATESSAEALEVAQGKDHRWLAVAAMFFLASVALTVGLPSVLTLFDHRTAKLGLTAVAVFAVGCIGTAGYAMLLAFFNALAKAGMVTSAGLDEVASDVGLGAFMVSWIAAFYLGELLIAVALLRARTVPVWVPLLLVAHVLSFPIGEVVPAQVAALPVLLVTIGFAGIGINANSRHLVTTTT